MEETRKKYNVQCERCYQTLYADALENGEKYTHIITGEICDECQEELDKEKYYDD